MSFSFASLMALLCGFASVSLATRADAATGSVKGVILSAADDTPVTQGSVCKTLI